MLFPQGTGRRWGFPGSSVVKNPPTMLETQVQSLHWEDPLEEGIDTHSNILGWRIPWTEEPGRLQFIGPHRAAEGVLQKGGRWAQEGERASEPRRTEVQAKEQELLPVLCITACGIWSSHWHNKWPKNNYQQISKKQISNDFLEKKNLQSRLMLPQTSGIPQG